MLNGMDQRMQRQEINKKSHVIGYALLCYIHILWHTYTELLYIIRTYAKVVR